MDAVLVVDDDPAAREMLARYLEADGFRVVTAAGGEEALEVARRIRPRAVTLDVVMPGMDGWSVLAAFKSDPELAAIPVVLLTIVDDPDRGYALGASHFLTKPVDRARLRSAIASYPLPAPRLSRDE